MYLDGFISLFIDIELMDVCGTGFGQCKKRKKYNNLPFGIRQHFFKGNQSLQRQLSYKIVDNFFYFHINICRVTEYVVITEFIQSKFRCDNKVLFSFIDL